MTCSRCKSRPAGPRYKTCDPCRAGQKRWRATHSDRSAAATLRWRVRNPDAYRRAQQSWLERNPDYHRRWQRENAERIRAVRLLWQEAHREVRRENSRRRRARIKQVSVVDFSQEQLLARLSMYHGKCWICKSSPGTQVDHVKPLARGGAHMLSNLRPACADCNKAKGAKWPYPN